MGHELERFRDECRETACSEAGKSRRVSNRWTLARR